MNTQEQKLNADVEQLQLLETMLVLQHTNNINTAGVDYYLKDLDWDTAILTETAEALESTDYKWWKFTENDIPNIQLEVVDVWHFLMSKFITEAKKKIYFSQVLSKPSNQLTDGYERNILLDKRMIEQVLKNLSDTFITKSTQSVVEFSSKKFIFSTKIFMKTLLEFENDPNSYSDLLFKFLNMSAASGLTVHTLSSKYLSKNALNTLRKNHGYKEGTYLKTWKDPNGVVCEDNDVALVITKDATSFNEAYSILENYYLNNISKSSL